MPPASTATRKTAVFLSDVSCKVMQSLHFMSVQLSIAIYVSDVSGIRPGSKDKCHLLKV